jgi:hypothetical protein
MIKLLLSIPLITIACQNPDYGVTECTEMAVASLNVYTTDINGDPLTPDSVTYTLDGGDTVDADCMNDDCSQWIAGWEVHGDITVTATLGNDEASASAIIELTEDECHVIGQEMTLALPHEG